MFGPHVNRVYVKGGDERPGITAHIKAARAVAAGVDFDARAFQIFVANPRGMSITLRPEEADELRKYIAESKIKVVAHGTYLDFPWKGSGYMMKFIRRELQMCERAGLEGLVIHLGKPPIEDVVKNLPYSNTPDGVLTYLETPHVKPENSHYETPAKLAELFKAIAKAGVGHKFGLCVDTAHLWSCGVDISGYETAEKWLKGLEAVAEIIPPKRIMLHINDSHDGLGSGLDHHAPLMEGKIWGGYKDRPKQSGLAAFVEYAVRHKRVAILERKPPKALLDDYSVLEKLTEKVRREG